MSAMLADRVVVVVGGGGLLGSAFVRAVVEHGAIAVVADLDQSAADRVAGEAAARRPGRVSAARVDIASVESVDALIDRVHSERGRIDAVVNSAYPRNAGFGQRLEDVTYPDFCDNVSLHLGGYFLVAQRFARFFSAQGHGNIISMGSIYGSTVPRFGIYEGTSLTMPVEYAAIKAGVIQLTRYFAQYFKGRHIRINSISPGGILTDQPEQFIAAYSAFTASKTMLAPADVTGTLLFLLSDLSASITGQNIVVDDGWSL